MTEMQSALIYWTARVRQNIALGLTSDREKEEAVALFRLARMVEHATWAQPLKEAR